MNPHGKHTQVTLSVVVPCYNEQATLKGCIQSLLDIRDATLELEIIIVDDGSSDDSVSIAEGLAAEHPQVHLIRHPANRGKGAALRTGFAQARGDYVAVQDADLEYDPEDLKRLLEPLRSGIADVVFGSRFSVPWGPPGSLLLALAGKRIPHPGLQHLHRPEPHGHGDLLQGFPARNHSILRDRRGPLRGRT